MNILQACRDTKLFSRWFKDPATYIVWFAFLAAVFGLPMDEGMRAAYRRHTGREAPPTTAFNEAWLVIGRRGGKSFFMALIAVFLACFHEYRQFLAPGERATVLVIAQDRKQARVIMRYVSAMLNEIPLLKRMVVRETADAFDLNNAVTIEVGTASFRSTRGYTYAAVLCDEIAFWRTDDAAEPDYAILDALRPGMSTIPTSMLIGASSPYARKGALWDAHRRYHGKEGAEVLVWQAATNEMNPTVRQSIIDQAYERDAASASAEYGAQFRSDIESFVSRDVVEACMTRGVLERAFITQYQYSYRAFVDPAGGSGKDSFTLAIGHLENGVAILDATRERKPPFSPEAVASEFAALVKSYGIKRVVGDKYAGEWPREQFRKHGVSYDASAQPRSDIYRDFLPLLNSGQVDLLDNEKLLTQIVGLERRTGRGRDIIDHARDGHDDVANSVAGVLVGLKARRQSRYIIEAFG